MCGAQCVGFYRGKENYRKDKYSTQSNGVKVQKE